MMGKITSRCGSSCEPSTMVTAQVLTIHTMTTTTKTLNNKNFKQPKHTQYGSEEAEDGVKT